MNKFLSILILAIFMIALIITSFVFHETILNFLINIDVNKFSFLCIYILCVKQEVTRINMGLTLLSKMLIFNLLEPKFLQLVPPNK